MTALDRLREHARRKYLSTNALAARLGVSREQVAPVMLGTRAPTRSLAERIQRETADAPGGPIRVSDWPELRDEVRR